MKRRTLVIAIVAFMGLVGGGAAFSYYSSTTAYTITYSHASLVTIVQLQDNNTPTIASLQRSGETVRIPTNGDYEVRYIGETGYASGVKAIAKDTVEVTVEPDFSDEHYATLISEALPAIQSAISEKYPGATSLFTIDKGAMYQKGAWFTAWLTYKGEYSFNSDNLRVLLKFEDNRWTLVTKPDILLTSINYPKVPVNVLSWANNLTF